MKKGKVYLQGYVASYSWRLPIDINISCLFSDSKKQSDCQRSIATDITCPLGKTFLHGASSNFQVPLLLGVLTNSFQGSVLSWHLEERK